MIQVKLKSFPQEKHRDQYIMIYFIGGQIYIEQHHIWWI